MAEENLEEMVREIDAYLVRTMAKYEVDPLKLSAIINARLMWINYLGGSEDDFKKALVDFSQSSIRGELH
jgi:hypothetical protein